MSSPYITVFFPAYPSLWKMFRTTNLSGTLFLGKSSNWSFKNGCFQLHLGVEPKIGVGLQNGWWKSWKTLLKWMIWRGFPIIFGSTPHLAIPGLWGHDSLNFTQPSPRSTVTRCGSCESRWDEDVTNHRVVHSPKKNDITWEFLYLRSFPRC